MDQVQHSTSTSSSTQTWI